MENVKLPSSKLPFLLGDNLLERPLSSQLPFNLDRPQGTTKSSQPKEARESFGVGFDASEFGYPSVKNYDSYITQQSISTNAFGIATIYNLNQIAKPYGFIGTIFGTDKAYNQTQIVSPSGYTASLFGTNNVSPRFIYVNGTNNAYVGKPQVYNLNQYLYPIGVLNQDFGSTKLTNTRQYVSPIGFNAEKKGVPTVWFYKRQLYVGAGDIGKVGEPFVMGGMRFIYPKGISHQVMYRYDYPNPDKPTYGIAYDEYSYPVNPNSSIDYLPYYSVVSYGLFGTQSIINRNVWIKPQGINSLSIGASSVTHNVRTVYHIGFDSLVFGYVADYTPPDNKGEGEKRPRTWENPSSSMIGYWENESWKPSGLTIYNGKRPISPVGIAHSWRDDRWHEQSFLPNPYIAYHIQTISSSGFDSLRTNNPTLNYKQTIRARGIYGTIFGALTEAINTKLFIVKPSGINSAVVEKPSVSPRFVIADGFNASTVSPPKVTGGLFQGFDSLEFGHHAIGHFIQTAKTLGFDSLNFSNNDIRHHISPLYPASAIRESGVFGDVVIYNRTRYIAPVGIEPYAISQWTVAYLDTQQAWAVGIYEVPISPPTIYNLTQIVYAQGHDSQMFGRAMVADYIRYLYQLGSRTDVYGKAYVWKTPKAETKGNEHSVFGQAMVSNRNRYIKTGNIYPPAIQVSKNITVDYKNKNIVVKGFDANVFGVIRVEDFLRYIEPLGRDLLSVGMAWISDSPRTIAPTSIAPLDIKPHFVSRNIVIEPKGFEATEWLTRIIPEIQAIYHQATESAIFGDTVVISKRQIVNAKAFASWEDEKYRYGIAKIFNSRQYIVQSDKQIDKLNETIFGQWTEIHNNNKTLAAFGINSLNFGYVSINNKAFPIIVSGKDELNVSSPMVAYRVRNVYAEDIEPASISQWSIIYNNARVIELQTIDSQSFGDADIKNTRRYYERVGNWDSQEFGVSMVAYRVRNIDIESRYAIMPPYIDLPKLENLTHYVETQGFTADGKWVSAVGVPYLFIHWNIIAPRWEVKEFNGEPFVWNKTPEVKIFGHDSAEFGAPALRTQWREVLAMGDNTNLFGLPKISDTKQYVKIIGGIGAPNISQYHKLTKGQSPPYALQYILHNESKSGFNSLIFGAVGMNQNVLYPYGIMSQKFGDAFVWSNNLIIKYGIAQQQEVSTPIIRNQNNYITFRGIDSEIKVGRPRIKLQTIYHYHEWGSRLIGGWVGRASVENQHRRLFTSGVNTSITSSGAGIDLVTRHIRPTSIRPPYFGIPSIPFVPQNVEVNGFDSFAGGLQMVSHPPYKGVQYIKTYGFNVLAFGYEKVGLKNRNIKTIGFDALRLGYSRSDTPYMWQSLRIGELVPFQLDGFDSAVFGGSMISLKIRDLLITGFDTSTMDYESKYFSKRMRVLLAEQANLDKTVSILGINDSTIGVHGVKHGQYFIRPDGDSETYRQGVGEWM